MYLFTSSTFMKCLLCTESFLNFRDSMDIRRLRQLILSVGNQIKWHVNVGLDKRLKALPEVLRSKRLLSSKRKLKLYYRFQAVVTLKESGWLIINQHNQFCHFSQNVEYLLSPPERVHIYSILTRCHALFYFILHKTIYFCM